MKLADFFYITDTRVTEGSDYQWKCYGKNVYTLTWWDGDYFGVAVECVYNHLTSEVFEMVAMDYTSSVSYRWIAPNYVDAYHNEVKQRKVADCAWDNVPYIDLELEEDMISKARAIVGHESYDPRISVPVDLSDDDLFTLMKLAHKHDVTFNQLAEHILKYAIDQAKPQEGSNLGYSI